MKFRKKPLVVEAIQLTCDDLSPFIKAWGKKFAKAVLEQEREHGLTLATDSGVQRVSMGNWIIRGTEGEFYACNAVVFEKIYEEVES